MTQKFRVTITRKAGLSDPEGATTKRALADLGFAGVDGVSFGRIITLSLDGDTTEDAIDEMCQKLLANPVMEHYTIERLS